MTYIGFPFRLVFGGLLFAAFLVIECGFRLFKFSILGAPLKDFCIDFWKWVKP